MVKIRIAIADKDEAYIERLINHFTGSYSDKLEIYSFTNLAHLMEFVGKLKIDVLIATEEFGVKVKEIPEKIAFAYLSDSASIDLIAEQKAICKYQKVDLIYKEILSLYSEHSSNDVIFKSGNVNGTKIFTFLSSSGGAGSSTVAAAFAMNIARRGKKVLYLNLEQFGSCNIFFSGEGNFNFSDVLFAIKSKKSNLTMKLESTVKHDESGVYFYDECKTPLDISEMTEDDIKKLLNELQISGLYEYVIISVDTIINKQVSRVLMYSKVVILVSDGSEISNNKLKKMFQTFTLLENQSILSIIPKLGLIYNKFSSTGGKYADGVEINVIGGVQRFAGGTSKQIAGQISENPMFNKLV